MKLLYFTTPFCGSCKAMLPAVRDVAAELRVAIEVVDCAEQPAIASRYQIQRVPSLLLIRDRPYYVKLDDMPIRSAIKKRIEELMV